MALQFYDTLARKKRVFEPADPSRVTMYVCGPTVYNYTHIGNARSAISFDLLFRVLRHHYGDGAVIYARNFTDIDDKIIKASQESGAPIAEITTKFAEIYRKELRALGALPPTSEPLATAHVQQMIGFIERLVAYGAAYEAQGHVLFAVDQFDKYGALSGVDQDEMIAGARVEVAPYKKNAADFVLWKPSSDEDPGWESPWGRGRPGWHLECSVMIEAGLGETIDIHCGGQDLRFPHHENEIAQSACVHDGAPLARYWMHNGFLRMGDDKMSKSLGNVVLTHELLEQWQGEVIRWALLSAHYRQPLEWTEDLLRQSKTQLDKFYRLLGENDDTSAEPPAKIFASLADDLNTPEAFAALHELRDKASQGGGAGRAAAIAELRAAGRLMGFFNADPAEWFKGDVGDGPTADEIEALMQRRADARAAKDFAASDRIRDDLASKGVIIEDGPDGATWRRR
ncbi:MAG: cysteine--tRNA ligase [Marinicaulis sp.]|nr:cysteine--tRNA ligase [Marinicaulis sp.]